MILDGSLFSFDFLGMLGLQSELFRKNKRRGRKDSRSLRNTLFVFVIFLVEFVIFSYLLIGKYVSLPYAEIAVIEPHPLPQESVPDIATPVGLRDSFVEDIRKGVNDDGTKSRAYAFIRRYLENGGNIYETYQLVHSTPELSFLLEAEDIYPGAFRSIRDERRPFVYSDEGMYVYLAYSEVLEKYGYANSALLAATVRRYIEMAYFKRMINNDHLLGKSVSYPDYSLKERENDVKKAVVFAGKANKEIAIIFDHSDTEAISPSRDVLDAIVQYAIALRYMESMSVAVESFKTSSELFLFALDYARRYFPETYPQIALSNAATLLLIDSAQENDFRNALYPFFSYTQTKDSRHDLIGRILRSKSESAHSRYADLSPYSRENIVRLANKSLEFKKWLISNGWEEKDFF